jgi:N-acetylglucosamine-6-phosphate deacetylase
VRLDVNVSRSDLRLARSGANTQQAVQAVAAGASLITHLFNAMPAFRK